MKLILQIALTIFISNIIARDIIVVKKNGSNIQYDHDIMRPYLSNDQIALDTEITYAKAIRLQMGALWKETAKLYKIIANRGHPVAQLHLGKQYFHGNGVEESLIEAYKWFFLSETAIGKHFIENISHEMTENQILQAKEKIKNFKPIKKFNKVNALPYLSYGGNRNSIRIVVKKKQKV